MDFITKFPKTAKGFDARWVIVDQLPKSAQFLAIRESSSAENLADVYVQETVPCHGVPVTIVLDRVFSSLPNSGNSSARNYA